MSVLYLYKQYLPCIHIKLLCSCARGHLEIYNLLKTDVMGRKYINGKLDDVRRRVFIAMACAAAAFDGPAFLQHREQDGLGAGAASRGGGPAEVPLLLPGSPNPERPGGGSLRLGHRQLPGRPAHAGQWGAAAGRGRGDGELESSRGICFVDVSRGEGLRVTVGRFCTAAVIVTIRK